MHSGGARFLRQAGNRDLDILTTEAGAEILERYWADWRQGDPRWRVEVIDTTPLTVAQVAGRVAGWIAREKGAGGG